MQSPCSRWMRFRRSLTFDMAQSPHTIDLLQFIDGNSTQLVPPVQLEPGKYTQLRLGVTKGSLVTTEGEEPLEIPSEYLKTDKILTSMWIAARPLT